MGESPNSMLKGRIHLCETPGQEKLTNGERNQSSICFWGPCVTAKEYKGNLWHAENVLYLAQVIITRVNTNVRMHQSEYLS